MDGPQLVSSDESQLCEWPFRGGTAPVRWLRGVFPCFAHLPSYSHYEAAFLQVLCFVIASSLRNEVTLLGRVCLSPRSERRLFLHLPGVWLESSRWGHPYGSSVSQVSIKTKTLRTPSLGFGAEPSRWGHPYWVVLRISARSIGTKASSIHLSLVASRWGHPTGRVWFSSHSIETKSSLDSWSVFLQDGVTLFGSVSNNLISSEGITTAGFLGAFFRPILGVSFCHPWVGRSALKSGTVPHSVVFVLVRTLCISLSPTKEWDLALLLLLTLLPLALPWWIGLLRRPRGDSFHLGVSCAGIPHMVAR